MQFSANTAVLQWLQLILKERFGLNFKVAYTSNNTLQVSLDIDLKTISVVSQFSVFSQQHSDLPCTNWDPESEGWRSVLGIPLVAPGTTSLPIPLIKIHSKGCDIGYDILGLTYWMLSRLEEIGRKDLDLHGRFPATASHAHKYAYLERPIVDEWLDIFGQVIRRTWPNLSITTHKSSVKVSHDVDSPSRYGFRTFAGILRAVTGDVVLRKNFGSPFIAPWVRYNTKNQLHSLDPDNTFNWIMDISEKCGMRSAFYFICGHTDPHDADYKLEHPAIRDLMRRIDDRGHEIGLHPSYMTYQKPASIQNEASRLREIIKSENLNQSELGARMHYLRFEYPLTLNALDAAAISYDTTLGYADHSGFRCGTCFEYPAFDPVSQKSLVLRIRPLIAMEVSVFGSSYMNLGVSEEAEEKLISLRKTCRTVGGCFTLLWHNCQFDNVEKQRMYKNVLEV
jgi:hypothetical protein